MTEFEKALEMLSKSIKNYREASPDDGNTLVQCLQQIAPILFYLEGERAKAHNKYQNIIHSEILKGTAVNRAENEAHVKVPEMYKLRKLIDSAYETTKAIGVQLSWIKTGMRG